MIPTSFTSTTELLMLKTRTALSLNVCIVVVRLAVILQERYTIVFTERSGKISALWHLFVAACLRVLHGFLRLISVTQLQHSWDKPHVYLTEERSPIDYSITARACLNASLGRF